MPMVNTEFEQVILLYNLPLLRWASSYWLIRRLVFRNILDCWGLLTQMDFYLHQNWFPLMVLKCESPPEFCFGLNKRTLVLWRETLSSLTDAFCVIHLCVNAEGLSMDQREEKNPTEEMTLTESQLIIDGKKFHYVCKSGVTGKYQILSIGQDSNNLLIFFLCPGLTSFLVHSESGKFKS